MRDGGGGGGRHGALASTDGSFGEPNDCKWGNVIDQERSRGGQRVRPCLRLQNEDKNVQTEVEREDNM